MHRADTALAWQIVLNTLDVERSTAVLGALLHAPALFRAVQPAAELVRDARRRVLEWRQEGRAAVRKGAGKAWLTHVRRMLRKANQAYRFLTAQLAQWQHAQ